MLTQAAPEVTLSLALLVFSEGLLAFLSPCILPLLPVYLMYLCGSSDVQSNRRRLLRNTLGFIAGFSIVFTLLGATASGLGTLLRDHRTLLTRVGGVVMIVFGLNFTGLLRIPFLNRTKTFEANKKNLKFFSSMVFGAAFSFGWTPCLGTFLGAALLLASSTATLWEGVGLLLVFSAGLGLPFLLTALLWNRLQGALRFIKQHFGTIRLVSGCLLICIGIVMLLGWLEVYMRIFS